MEGHDDCNQVYLEAQEIKVEKRFADLAFIQDYFAKRLADGLQINTQEGEFHKNLSIPFSDWQRQDSNKSSQNSEMRSQNRPIIKTRFDENGLLR